MEHLNMLFSADIVKKPSPRMPFAKTVNGALEIARFAKRYDLCNAPTAKLLLDKVAKHIRCT